MEDNPHLHPVNSLIISQVVLWKLLMGLDYLLFLQVFCLEIIQEIKVWMNKSIYTGYIFL